MTMKKQMIVALVGLMILAVTAPALAANVGGSMDFGYQYNLLDKTGTDNSAWGWNLNGNVSDNVAFKIGFAPDDLGAIPPLSSITEAWLQAKGTPIGTVKLGAFDMGFGEANNTKWADPAASVLNAQVDNQLMGMNVSTGVQFANGNPMIHAAGASVNVKPFQGLDATAGVLVQDNVGTWEPSFGYAVAYSGIQNLTLGVKGNIQNVNQDEIVGNAEYQIMPGIKINGKYGKNVYNGDYSAQDETLMQVGADATIGNIHGAASYAVATNGGVDVNTVSVSGDYSFQLAQGLTTKVFADYSKASNATADSNLGFSASIAF